MLGRNCEHWINNFGFRLHYNRLYKAEYLPARIKYNTAFFFFAAAIVYAI